MHAGGDSCPVHKCISCYKVESLALEAPPCTLWTPPSWIAWDYIKCIFSSLFLICEYHPKYRTKIVPILEELSSIFLIYWNYTRYGENVIHKLKNTLKNKNGKVKTLKTNKQTLKWNYISLVPDSGVENRSNKQRWEKLTTLVPLLTLKRGMEWLSYHKNSCIPTEFTFLYMNITSFIPTKCSCIPCHCSMFFYYIWDVSYLQVGYFHNGIGF